MPIQIEVKPVPEHMQKTITGLNGRYVGDWPRGIKADGTSPVQYVSTNRHQGINRRLLLENLATPGFGQVFCVQNLDGKHTKGFNGKNVVDLATLEVVIASTGGRLTRDQREFFESLEASVPQSERVKSQPVERSGKRTKITDEKTKTELRLAAVKNDYLCYGCMRKFGGFMWVDLAKPPVILAPEHGHLTKARGIGGTKEDDYPVCSVCQRIQGLGEGFESLLEFRIEVARVHKERGYVYVAREKVMALLHESKN